MCRYFINSKTFKALLIMRLCNVNENVVQNDDGEIMYDV